MPPPQSVNSDTAPLLSIDNVDSLGSSRCLKENGLSGVWRGLRGKSSVHDLETAVLTLQNMTKADRMDDIVSTVS